MAFAGMNYLAILVAAVAAFAWGAAYYMTLSKQWLAAVGRTEPNKSAVPFILSFVALIVMAAVLFVGHEPVMKQLGIRPLPEGETPAYTPKAWRILLCAQFMVSVYGGYFGAGIGIMMLASLSVMRFGDLFRVNALKNLAAFLINVFAAVLFGILGLVEWKVAFVMAVGATCGALFGAGGAKAIGPRNLRIVISIFGFVIAGCYIYKNIAGRFPWV